MTGLERQVCKAQLLISTQTPLFTVGAKRKHHYWARDITFSLSFKMGCGALSVPSTQCQIVSYYINQISMMSNSETLKIVMVDIKGKEED